MFVADLATLELVDDDRHHLERSLRLRDGDPFTASDAAGSWRAAVFGDTAEASSEIYTVDPPRYEVGLGIALTKATKPEFAVQKATELGIDRIVVFQAAHSVARWDEKKRSKNEERLAKVAREAAMQSRRVVIPTVTVTPDLTDLAGTGGLVRADFGGIPTNSDHRFVVIGPEGGWSDAERNLVPTAVDLGQNVLRAETAAVVASVFLAQARRRSD